MNRWDPLVLMVLGAAISMALDLVARGRDGGDSGTFWAGVCGRFCLWAGLPLLILAVVENGGWFSGYFPPTSRWWMLVVLLAWLALAVPGLLRRQDRQAGRWLAGAVGFAPGRWWILGFVAVLAPAIYAGLAGWTEPWKAAHWTFATLLAMSLAATALSRLGARMRTATDGAVVEASLPSADVPPWPEAMRSAGIGIELLRTVEAKQTAAAPGVTKEWEERLAAYGSRGVAPELLAAAHEVAAAKATPAAVSQAFTLFAPDQAGQAEATALAAWEMAQRTGETTLVITPDDGEPEAQEIRRWAPPPTGSSPGLRVALVDSSTPAWFHGDVWVASAETLSEFLLAHLKEDADKVSGDRPVLHRIGLVVWWDVHLYSGIRAANVWAISRRLVRLLAAHGRTGLRTLVFSRSFPHASAQATAFIERLLPYPFSREREIRMESRQARQMQVHLVSSPLAESVAASVRTGWRTFAGGGAGLDRAAESAIWNLGPSIREKLAANSAFADARIIAMEPGDVLSLPEILCQGGRSGSQVLHHAAILAPENPYVEFVLEEYRQHGKSGSSRYLVGAEGHTGLIRRHAEHALREAPDTMAGLRHTFSWEEDVLAATLRDLSSRGQLSRQAVRFLDAGMRLQRDYLYASLQPAAAAGRPLDTFGTDLIELRDKDAPEREGLLMRIDPERITIDAYPRRVFFHAGRRYRVAEWNSAAGVERLGCSPEDHDFRTWRCRNARLQRIEIQSAEMVGRGRRRYSVSAEYWEELTSTLEVTPAGAMTFTDFKPVKASFPTRAIVLETGDENPETLHLAAMAFRHLLPVHVGVAEGYLDALPLSAVKAGRRTIFGLAIVDLFPGGGIGLVSAIEQDDALLQLLIDRAWLWLSEAQRRNQGADALFARSPLAAATGSTSGLPLGPAVRFLERMTSVGGRGR